MKKVPNIEFIKRNKEIKRSNTNVDRVRRLSIQSKKKSNQEKMKSRKINLISPKSATS